MNLGLRVRYFRQRKGISQFELENILNMSNGSLSRLENNVHNPTKETIEKIAKVLEVNSREIDYLLGSLKSPVSEMEGNEIIKKLDSYINSNKMLYIVDDRWRLFAASKAFMDNIFVDKNDKEKEKIYTEALGKTIIEIMLDVRFIIRQLYSPEEFKELLEYQLVHYYEDCNFMIDDEFYLRTLESIKKDSVAKRLWDNITDLNRLTIYDNNKRTLKYNLKDRKVNFYYTVDQVPFSQRFFIVEYKSHNS